MAVGDLSYSSFQVGSSSFNQSPSGLVQHIAAVYPSSDYLVLGSKLVGATGTGGGAAARMLVFAVRLTA